MSYQAVVFDLDGTLLNTLEDLTDAVNFSLKKYHKPERTINEICCFVGNGIAKLIERSVPRETDIAEQQKILTTFREYYGKHCQDKTAPYQGILEVLEELKEKKIKMAVVSNKADFAVQELIPVYFGDLFMVVKGENEAAGIRKKPAPDMVQAALRELGCSKEQAVYVGDSDVDLLTAKNAELPCIGVSWGFRGRTFLQENGAKMIADEPKDILKFVY